jgi:RNA polymerase sigma-70 factor (ECF subfamily)
MLRVEEGAVMHIKAQQFENYVAQYKGLIITICLAMTKNYFDAEDLAQETFLAAYRGMERFDGKDPKAWLTTIAVNKCRDYLKSPVHKNLFLSESDMAIIADTGTAPEEQAEKNSSEALVRKLCGRLREPYRSVAQGYFCEGKKLSQMAKETGQRLRTLETRLYRSKKLLKVLWKEEQEDATADRSKRSCDTSGAS